MKRWMWSMVACAIIGASGATGCGKAPGPEQVDAGGGAGDGGSDGGETPAPFEPQIVWEPCNLFTEGPESPAECATFFLPLRWDEPQGGTFTYFVKKKPATKPRRGSLWLLDGGPGFAGISLEGLAYMIGTIRLADLDIYIPSHRGTGQSSRLGCPVQEAEESPGGTNILDEEWDACLDEVLAQWGADGLAAFNVTEAAGDLAGLIDATRQPGDQVFVYGASYGTYLANRYLQLRPSQATGVVMDSVCPGEGCYLAEQDVLFDEVGRELIARCEADAWCGAKVGQGLYARYAQAIGEQEAGTHCSALKDAGIDKHVLRLAMGIILNDRQLRQFVPAIAHRFVRCSTADVAALQQLVSVLFGGGGGGQDPVMKAHSWVLAENIVLSEMWPHPAPPTSVLRDAAEAALISLETSINSIAIFDRWPRYPRDPYADRFASTRVPMLMMNGTLDPSTAPSLAAKAKAQFNAPNQHYVELPDVPHGVLHNSPMTTPNKLCGIELLLQFVEAPEAGLDLSCVDQLLPLDLQGQPGLSQHFFGTAELYD